MAVIFLQTLRNYGIPDYLPIKIAPWQQATLVVSIGTLIGVIFGAIQIYFEAFYEKKVSIRKLLIKTLAVQVLTIMLIAGVIYGVYTIGFGLKRTFVEFIREPNFTVFFFYSILVNFMLSFLRQVNLLLGPGNLLRFLRGDFYYPHEEARIFMFLDLRASTTLAEQLGHLRYSQLIQDCFSDLTVVTRFKTSVYQYVGDEAVLTWTQRDGLTNQNCLRAFFAYRTKLRERSGYYQQAYGVTPVFKAGVNIGTVTVAEVGVVKREIAFHGDAINTAARIQGQCNALDRELLISASLCSALREPVPSFVLEEVGAVPLRGRQEAVTLYAVQEAEQLP